MTFYSLHTHTHTFFFCTLQTNKQTNVELYIYSSIVAGLYTIWFCWVLFGLFVCNRDVITESHLMIACYLFLSARGKMHGNEDLLPLCPCLHALPSPPIHLPNHRNFRVHTKKLGFLFLQIGVYMFHIQSHSFTFVVSNFYFLLLRLIIYIEQTKWTRFIFQFLFSFDLSRIGATVSTLFCCCCLFHSRLLHLQVSCNNV